MALFVKRTFAIMVSSTSGTDQCDGGGGGKDGRGCVRESWTSLVLWGMSSLGTFKRHPSETTQILSHGEPGNHLVLWTEDSVKAASGCQASGQWVSSSQPPWGGSSSRRQWSCMLFPSRRTPPREGLRPGGQSKRNEITLLLVQFCPFHRQLGGLEHTVLETLFVVINYPLFILIYLLNQVPKGVLFVSDVKNPVAWSQRGTPWFLICMCLFSWVFHEGESKGARNADHTLGLKAPGLVVSVFAFHK